LHALLKLLELLRGDAHVEILPERGVAQKKVLLQFLAKYEQSTEG
jgi:hypothetical protein